MNLQPRYPDTPVDFRPMRLDDGSIATRLTNWPHAPRGDLDTVRELSRRLSSFIQHRRGLR
ncbi:MAG TPA: hypothetical protein VM345_11540 [Acidimicrobiales bacterium]|nr:hypothetical protein [Acidimicrobiales bacterium]